MSDTCTYNGYKNYATWAVNLHYGADIDDWLEGKEFDSMYEAMTYVRERVLDSVDEQLEVHHSFFMSDIVYAALDDVDFYRLVEVRSDSFCIRQVA